MRKSQVLPPFDTAGILSRLTFDYIRPLLRLGASRSLQEADLEPLAARDKPSDLVVKVEAAWKAELQRAHRARKAAQTSGHHERPSLLRALIVAFRSDFCLAAVLALVEDATVLAQVALVRPLMTFLEDPDADVSRGYELACCMAMASFMQAVIHHQNFLVTMRGGWNLRISVTGVLHGKLLRLSQSALHNRDSASVANLIGSDVLRFDNVMPFVHLGWTAVLVFGAVLYLLHAELGIASTAAGACTMLGFIALQIKFSRQYASRRRKTARITDQRVRLTSEMLSGVGSVKAYAWEEAFLAQLARLRGAEHASIFVSQSMKACTLALYFAAPAISSLACFGTYVYVSRRTLNVGTVYSAIALLHCMRTAIGKHMSRFLETAPEVCVAVQRMQQFLLLPEVKRRGHQNATVVDDGGNDHGGVYLKDACFGRLISGDFVTEHYEGSDDDADEKEERQSGGHSEKVSPEKYVKALEKINLNVGAGEVLLVTGPVGCGKSTLLEGILGEIALTSGTCRLLASPITHASSPDAKAAMSATTTTGSATAQSESQVQVAYCPQDAWIMSGSLESNILFGAPLDQARLDAVVDCCCLGPDIQQLPGGLATEIGEKGVNLSGGQKARVSLARAAYARASVVLLDDPLSAVDPAVARDLFDRCIKRWLAIENRAAVVLVTHQRQFMTSADVVAVMDTASLADSDEMGSSSLSVGILKAVGTLADLRQRGFVAAEEVADLGDHDSEDDGIEGALDVSRRYNDRESAKPSTSGVKEEATLSSESPAVTKLVKAEDREMGVVRWSTWKGYLLASGGVLAGSVVALFMGGQVLLMLSDWWLGVWAEQYEGNREQRDAPHYRPLLVFLALAVSATGVSFVRALLFFHATLQASSTLHRQAAASVFAAPLSFFAMNPLGRVLNRFSSDLAQMDELLAVALFDTLQIVCMCLAGVSVACAVLPYICILVPPVLGVMVYLRAYTTSSMRELKRLDGVSRSPVYSFFSASLHGLVPIRAYGRGAHCQHQFVGQHLTRNATCWFWWLIANRWFGFWLDMLCFVMVSATTLLAVALRDSTDPGLVGLALVYVLALSGMFQYMMRQTALVETFMTSVERLSHYAHCLASEEDTMQAAIANEKSPAGSFDGRELKSVACHPVSETDLVAVLENGTAGVITTLDAADGCGGGTVVDEEWPARGAIEMRNLRVRYRHDLPEVIKGITASLAPGSKVGVVGRTGSGKSSLLLALSRLNEVCGGRVLIDGVDVSLLPLTRLRRAIAVIPQEPVLFSGDVRFNLDPFQEFDDSLLWAALDAVRLGTFVREQGAGLQAPVQAGGSTWSVGQRQLLSIARALLHQRRVVLLDEATASVDFESDRAIQAMLRGGHEKQASIADAKEIDEGENEIMGSAALQPMGGEKVADIATTGEPKHMKMSFEGSTLIVIAHRIDTIIDSDQILVLDNGRLVENGAPATLVSKHDGVFASMVAASRSTAE